MAEIIEKVEVFIPGDTSVGIQEGFVGIDIHYELDSQEEKEQLREKFRTFFNDLYDTYCSVYFNKDQCDENVE